MLYWARGTVNCAYTDKNESLGGLFKDWWDTALCLPFMDLPFQEVEDGSSMTVIALLRGACWVSVRPTRRWDYLFLGESTPYGNCIVLKLRDKDPRPVLLVSQFSRRVLDQKHREENQSQEDWTGSLNLWTPTLIGSSPSNRLLIYVLFCWRFFLAPNSGLQ